MIPYIDGGEAAWKELSVGKSSNQLVGVLVGSLIGKDNPGPVEEFFEGEVNILLNLFKFIFILVSKL